MKKTIALAITLTLVFTLAACGAQTLPSGGGTNTPPPFSGSGTSSDAAAAPTDDSSAVIGDGSGTYEGETDANGLFSGYGIWVYHNFRYEGYFENGLPNGEGMLYQALDEWNNTFTGRWVNGYAEGDITWIISYHDGHGDFTFHFAVANGQANVNVPAVEKSDYIMEITYENNIFAVPPFVERPTIPSLSAIGNGSDTQSPLIPGADAQDIPDNGAPPIVAEPLLNHAGDKAYFYTTTDDYIVYTNEAIGHQIIDAYGLEAQEYNILSFDSTGRWDSAFSKLVFSSQDDALVFINHFTSGAIQIENVIYFDSAILPTAQPPSDMLQKADALSVIIRNGYDHYVSKP